jgi:hypothetical protein
MKNKYPFIGLIAVLLGAGNGNFVKAENISLTDTSYSFVGLPTTATANVSLRFGLWNPTTFTFTQQVFGDAHLGYAMVAGDEMQINLSQTDNTIYSTNTSLALAIFTKNNTADAGPLDYSVLNADYRAIFTNPGWVVGALANNTSELSFNLDANTVAVLGADNKKIGDFLFNGGNQTITLIPEPSTGALMMIGAAGLVALRRLRKV